MSHAEGEAARRRDIVVIGTSAGGVEALATIARDLPADFPAAVFMVLHMPTGGTSSLPLILARTSSMSVHAAEDGAPIAPGTITVAPPDCHLLLEGDRVRLVRGPKVNGYRPSVDVLFQSAAREHDGRVVGVVCTGNQSDGARGLYAIKRRGGAAVVQTDALYEGMPASAMRMVEVDAAVPLREIATTLTMLVEEGKEGAVDGEESTEEAALEGELNAEELQEKLGDPTLFRCPECGGALWNVEESGLEAFVCHVGHSFSVESFRTEQRDSLERALWSAVQMLEERAALNDRLAAQLDARGLSKSRSILERKARRALDDAGTIRKILEAPDGVLQDRVDEDEAA